MQVTSKRGIFSLNKVLQKQYKNQWSTKYDVWLVPSPSSPSPSPGGGGGEYGYFGGGFDFFIPSEYSSVDRIDYSNDTATASPKGPLSVARSGLSAASPQANGL